MNELEEKFYETRVVPVVVLEDAEDAVPLAQALVEGGLLSAEVTFRTAAAEESIRRMTEAFPQMLVGAGTVLTKEQVDAAAAAGAKFIVSPGFDPEIVDYCLEKKIPVLPGCISPSEVAQAVKRGLTIVKFFPAEQAGGIAMIKAMAAPYVAGAGRYPVPAGCPGAEGHRCTYRLYQPVRRCGHPVPPGADRERYHGHRRGCAQEV